MSADEIIAATLREDYTPTDEEISTVLAQLTNTEKKWRDRAEMLEKEGYVLRPRLQPGWTPSWFESGMNPITCEDAESLPVANSPNRTVVVLMTT